MCSTLALMIFRKIPVGTHPTLKAIDGAVAPDPVTSAGPESDLDFQISYPLIYPQNSILFQSDDPVYEANYTFNGIFNTFLDALDGSYCSTISPLDPPYPDPSTAAGAYKGKLQCGVYKPVSKFSILTWRIGPNLNFRRMLFRYHTAAQRLISQNLTKHVNATSS